MTTIRALRCPGAKMKEQFSEFSPSNEVDFASLWRNAHFVIDTNVLLNLYRYQSKTRDELLNMLEKLSSQMWIPHYVALEFQRKRLTVIAEQNRKFKEVREVANSVRKKLTADFDEMKLAQRHSLIDPTPLVEGFNKLADDFLAKLQETEEQQQSLTGDDPIKSRIESIFEGRVGPKPNSQADIDAAYKDARNRYTKEIPPGYKDVNKGSREFYYDGIIYAEQYGDYLIWKQILDFARAQKIENLVFVTDDAKEDWWWIINSNGPKTLGPRPELVSEAKILGGIKTFKMYKPAKFSEYSNTHFEATISPESITEIKDIARNLLDSKDSIVTSSRKRLLAEEATGRWIERNHKILDKNRNGFPDYITLEEDKVVGYEIRYLEGSLDFRSKAQKLETLARRFVSAGKADRINFVWSCENEHSADKMYEYVFTLPKTRKVGHIIGVVHSNDGGQMEFTPIFEFSEF